MTTDNTDQGSGIDSQQWDRGSRGFAGIGSREAQQIVGTTDADEHRRRVAETEGAAERRQAAHERDRQSGIGVSPSLDNPIGQRLLDGPLAGLKRNTQAAGDLEYRLDLERDELLRLEAGERDGELLAAAWTAATANKAIPAVIRPAMDYDRSIIPTTHPIARHKQFVERLYGHWANEGRESVLSAWKDIEEALGEETIEVLKDAVNAYRTLVDATGETGNADAVIADGRREVLAAFREWPKLVEQWRDVQCVRQWLTVVEHNGFSEKRPESLNRTDAQMLERDVWRGQFPGVEIDVDTPEAALAWYGQRETGLSITAQVGV